MPEADTPEYGALSSGIPAITARQAYTSSCRKLRDAGFPDETAGRDARELLGFCLGKDGLRLLLDLDEPLSPSQAAQFVEMTDRLAGREPMAYITGRQEFAGLDIPIVPGVLIPRRDTMILLEQALARIPRHEAVHALELGCGSGAVIAALATERPLLTGMAIDVDPLAVSLTKENLRRFGFSERIRVAQSVWFDGIDRAERFGVIVSNPPYISTAEMSDLDQSVKKEPETALWGGDDGLDAYRRILPQAYKALDRQGWCLMEIGWRQGAAVSSMFQAAGFVRVDVIQDEGGRDRVVAGQRPELVGGEDAIVTENGADATRIDAKKTAYWRIRDAGDPRIAEAGRILRDGGLVAFPTETVYGLGANGFDETAVAGIYAAKGRPADNPLILHVASFAQARSLAGCWSEKTKRITEKLWPGPLTVVVPAATSIPGIVTAGLDTVAIRYPSAPVAQALIRAAGVPIAAPSANTSGRPSPTRAAHVWDDMEGRIDLILDGGPCTVGIESTILDLSVEPPGILRPGDITREAICRIIGEVRGGGELPIAAQDMAQGAAPAMAPARDAELSRDFRPKAPGMKYRHYAPKAPVTILQGAPQAVAAFVARLRSQADPKVKTAFLLSDETWNRLAAPGDVCGAVVRQNADENDKAVETPEARETPEASCLCRNMGSRGRPGEMGMQLYDALRACDRANVSGIYVEACTAEGQGAAVLDRLQKAAGNRIIVLATGDRLLSTAPDDRFQSRR